MTQAQLATNLAEKVGIERKQSKGLLDELTALVVKQLKKEGASAAMQPQRNWVKRWFPPWRPAPD
jgi:hypothetical protein